MGWRYKKSINVGGGMRINISKSGVGFSWGIPGFRQSAMSNGRTRTTYSVPGTGISYVEEKKVQNRSTEKQGTYSEYDTSILGKETIETYKALVTECNDWMEREQSLIYAAIIGAIAVMIGWLWFTIRNGLHIWFGGLLLASYLGYCIYYWIGLCRSKVIIEYSKMDDSLEYSMLQNLAEQMGKNQKLQHLYGKTEGLRRRTNAGATTNLSLQDVVLSRAKPRMIKTNINCFCLNMWKNDLYFFPDVIILIEKRKMYVINYRDVTVKYHTHDIIDYGKIAADAEIVGYRWQFSNNDGSRDRRFSNNRKIPVCRNGQMTLSLANNIILHIIGSNKMAMKNTAEIIINIGNVMRKGAQDYRKDEEKSNAALQTAIETKSQEETISEGEMTKPVNESKIFDVAYLCEALKPLYIDLLDECKKKGIVFRKTYNANDREAYTCVPMFVGKDYITGADDSVMIVGRAVNGWDVAWPTDTRKMVDQLLNQSFDLTTINDLPNQDGYYFSRSRFFLVIKEMMKKFGANNEDWSSRFVWSNLYKVAPAIEGNPNGKVQYAQRELAIKILKKEIDILKPKYIVFVTGYDFTTWSWRNNVNENTFRKEFNLQPTDEHGKSVEGYAIYNDSKIVVACRPEMKSVADWVEDVWRALSAI